MSIVSLLAGLVLFIIGIVIWRFKAVGLLAGYNRDKEGDNNRLATATGSSLTILGNLLLLESLLIYKGIIAPGKAIFVVTGTIILGVAGVGVISSYFSKHF